MSISEGEVRKKKITEKERERHSRKQKDERQRHGGDEERQPLRCREET